MLVDIGPEEKVSGPWPPPSPARQPFSRRRMDSRPQRDTEPCPIIGDLDRCAKLPGKHNGVGESSCQTSEFALIALLVASSAAAAGLGDRVAADTDFAANQSRGEHRELGNLGRHHPRAPALPRSAIRRNAASRLDRLGRNRQDQPSVRRLRHRHRQLLG